MKKIEEQLAEYRRKKALEKEHQSTQNVDASTTRENADPRKERSYSLLHRICKYGDDLLDIYPLRAWRAYMERCPTQCICVTLSLWLIMQLGFAYMEFGFVFFIFSLFMAMILNLGQRRPDEPSAYSVFNPNCERLLGTLTAEHFERDLLRRNVPVP
uniref:SAYSvFN domain-containing protein n=1 Tax=Ascaris lumbricoides TaxID=6252 RepID=A0A9J2PLI5_ASCLU